ncbi:DNA-3-methyladenine glycosylase 2 family protein [Streptomyces sp. NBC_00237]|uniref:DNA-3-methyladenine glycosylase family protein n=1 Tax=Streptomyces sp. NBC_00237 TaxID=2975687 RepID=UPI0022555705|nr:DNA-3-methyladenine glycosylase 2 family protein [Streptomyces sp. NBC_00237]MCX5200821.1 DNA-3-methyladenine glycosylase 2 family protein [Streptomyces sp. NBC_00237]
MAGRFQGRVVLGPLRRGGADPTYRVAGDGAVWRVSRTPEGPATLRVAEGLGEAWGPGAAWMLGRLPALLGEADDPGAFVAHHRVVAQAQHRHPGLRLCRTGLVLESLIPSVLEQKVTTAEAYASWRHLVRKFGEPAPLPDDDRPFVVPEGLRVMPDPLGWARIPSWEWHLANVDAKRADTVVRAVRVAARLEEAAGMPYETAKKRLEAVPGIGPWTSAETLQRSNGAPDALTVGDLHLPGIVGYALTGKRGATDADMLELLAPYAGQRHRAARYILLTGLTPPRRGPRRAPGRISHL